jgi:hypothetical protein
MTSEPGVMVRLLHWLGWPRRAGRCFAVSCGYEEPHGHGFACGRTCGVCGGR